MQIKAFQCFPSEIMAFAKWLCPWREWQTLCQMGCCHTSCVFPGNLQINMKIRRMIQVPGLNLPLESNMWLAGSGKPGLGVFCPDESNESILGSSAHGLPVSRGPQASRWKPPALEPLTHSGEIQVLLFTCRAGTVPPSLRCTTGCTT